MAAKIEIYPSGTSSATGKRPFRWRCRAANGQIVATGHQSFASRFNADRAAMNAVGLMCSAEVVDVKK